MLAHPSRPDRQADAGDAAADPRLARACVVDLRARGIGEALVVVGHAVAAADGAERLALPTSLLLFLYIGSFWTGPSAK